LARAKKCRFAGMSVLSVWRGVDCVRCMSMLCGGFGDECVYWLLCVGVLRGSLYNNRIGPEGGAAIAGALRLVPSLTQLKYVVGEGTSHEAAGCVG
jgi:hypothetical protein